MTLPPPSHDRCQVVIPAQGMVDVRDALTDILVEFGGEIKPGRHFETLNNCLHCLVDFMSNADSLFGNLVAIDLHAI